GTTCSMTVGTIPAAGNLSWFECEASGFANPGYNPIASVNFNGGSTLIAAPAAIGGQNSSPSSGISYILPSTNTGAASTSIVVTFTNSASGGYGCGYYE